MSTDADGVWYYTMAELMALPKEPPLVRFDAKHSTFDFDAGNGFAHEGTYYWDVASDYATPRAIVESIRHLSEKAWFTADHLRQLLQLLDRQS